MESNVDSVETQKNGFSPIPVLLAGGKEKPVRKVKRRRIQQAKCRETPCPDKEMEAVSQLCCRLRSEGERVLLECKPCTETESARKILDQQNSA